MENKLPRSKLSRYSGTKSRKVFFFVEMNELDEFKKIFDPKLLAYLKAKKCLLTKIDPKTTVILEEIEKLVLAGGKRFRPALCFYGYLACGGRNKKQILKASFALELGQAFALIHDDIIDNSSTRRGQPTVFKKLGLAGAILSGDLACTLADEIFTNLPFAKEFTQKAKQYFDLLKEEVIAGQYLDILGAENEAEVLKILEYKTARYSFVRPLQIGAALAGAKKEVFNIFENYGLPLGMAFQIKDDILGIFGEEKVIGKSASSDLREGKKTLLVIKTLERAGEGEKRKFHSLLGNEKATNKDLAWVRNLMVKTKALDYSQALAEKLVKKAKNVLDDCCLEKEGKDFLLNLADFVLKRNF